MIKYNLRFTSRHVKVKYTELPVRARKDITRLAICYAASRCWNSTNKATVSSFDCVKPTEEGLKDFAQLAFQLVKNTGVDVKAVGDVSLMLDGNHNLTIIIEYVQNNEPGINYVTFYCIGTNSTVDSVLRGFAEKIESEEESKKFFESIDFPKGNEDLITIISVESKNLQ